MSLPSPYLPAPQPSGRFVALEGVGGIGKTTLAAELSTRWNCRILYTAPTPLYELQPFANRDLAALPHLTFYLLAAMHVSDQARRELAEGRPVVADRYLGSVIANHAAVHRLPNAVTRATIGDLADNLATPTITIYLQADSDELRERAATRPERDRGRPPMSTDLLDRLQERFTLAAAQDPTAHVIPTAGRTASELADAVDTLLAVRAT